MNPNRNYNVVYCLGPFVLQILQQGQHDGIIVDLLPAVTLAINNGKSRIAFGFQWICGTVNFGLMSHDYREGERKRRERIKQDAAKMGITPRQYALRWGW